eukprot:TRINITY_DN450_c0_g3_i1.p1 TRINITY_DN450_c0_g3~~TRINITY_DN450_c0_g3_i1.p1  ORF type:complete len:367 (-),score=25.57 TRINITY_DN450_c0_g3_i1:475-1575(-)
MYICGSVDESLKPIGKAFIGIVIVTSVVVTIFSIGIVTLLLAANIQPTISSNSTVILSDNSTIFVSEYFITQVSFQVSAITASAFQTYFCIIAVANENPFALGSWLVSTGFICARVVEQYRHFPAAFILEVSYPRIHDIIAGVTLGMMVGLLLINVSLVVLAYFVFRGFGQKMYRTVGTSTTLRASFRDYQIFLSVLLSDFLMGLLLALVGGGLGSLANADDRTHAFGITETVLLVFNCLWTPLGWRGVVTERKAFLVPFFVFLPFLPIETAVRIAFLNFSAGPDYVGPWATNCRLLSCDVYMLAAAGMYVLRILLVIAAIRCIRNFDQGLVDVQKRDTAFEVADIGDHNSTDLTSVTNYRIMSAD